MAIPVKAVIAFKTGITIYDDGKSGVVVGP
jgi:hypothetical protein